MAMAKRGRKKDVPGIDSQFRDALEGDGRTPGRLARESGVNESAIRRYLSRERGLTLESTGRLAAVLGLRFVKVKARRST